MRVLRGQKGTISWTVFSKSIAIRERLGSSIVHHYLLHGGMNAHHLLKSVARSSDLQKTTSRDSTAPKNDKTGRPSTTVPIAAPDKCLAAEFGTHLFAPGRPEGTGTNKKRPAW